jgi:hypothetical protein
MQKNEPVKKLTKKSLTYLDLEILIGGIAIPTPLTHPENNRFTQFINETRFGGKN